MTDSERSRAWRASRLAAKRYRESGNKLYLLEAAGIAIDAEIPLPEDARQYIARVCLQLANPENTRSKVLKALEFPTCGPSLYTQRQKYERDLKLIRLAKKLGASLDQFAQDEGRDPDSLKRQQRRRTNTPPHLSSPNALHSETMNAS